ncbi:hypothetical protein YC2023_113301 [Brassica napus]
MRAAWSWFGAALGDRTLGLDACESGDGTVEGLGSAKPKEIRNSSSLVSISNTILVYFLLRFAYFVKKFDIKIFLFCKQFLYI